MPDNRLVLNVIRIFNTRKHRMFTVKYTVKLVMDLERNIHSTVKRKIS
jgi:hypothetical protein